MELLEERIRRDGVVKAGGVLKVDAFLNHQMDIELFSQMAEEWKRLFAGKPINKILTIEASGIGIAAVVAHLKSQGEPEYHSEILKTNVVTLGDSSPSGEGGSEADDPLLWEAADVVVSSDLGSTSNLQRRLKVGYARAGRIMDQLEEKGIVGPANGSRPREVLVDQMELETLKAFEAADE